MVNPWDEGQRTLVQEDETLSLDVEESKEWPMTWQMPWAGDDQVVEFLLFIDGQRDPYRSLRLWLDVVEP